MENIITASHVYIINCLNSLHEILHTLKGILLLIVLPVIFTLFILYRKLRRKFPFKVNCWFCSGFSKVPYAFINSWVCPHCEQYNGFNKDGGYNKVIKEQHDPSLNEKIFRIFKSPFKNNKKTPISPAYNGLCRLCNINQQLKIEQLAFFSPINEDNYYEELEEYRQKLEKAYHLCEKCEITVKETLEKQDYNLVQNRLNNYKQGSYISRNAQSTNKYTHNKVIPELIRIGTRGLRFICIVIACLLFVTTFFQFEAKHYFKYLIQSDFIILESVQSVFKELRQYVRQIKIFARELSFLGLFCCLLTFSEGHVKRNRITLFAWVLTHLSFWTNLKSFQILTSTVCFILNIQAIQSKQIYFIKKTLPKKYFFQTQKKNHLAEGEIFSNEQSVSTLSQQESLETLTDYQDITAEFQTVRNKKGKARSISPVNLTMNSMNEFDSKKCSKKKENEVEAALNEVKKENQKKPCAHISDLKSGTSIINKLLLSNSGVDKNEESMESFDEVYNGFTGLHLGGKQKSVRRSSNFLFENHNFSERKDFSSIIKPAKFIKNLSGSSTYPDSNESASRSSTPSSGYSSQKTDKMESNRYNFTKSITPLTVNPYSRSGSQDYFAYYDGNNQLFNNFNCFSPGFVPLQHFPGPLGHTTVYTYTRPNGFPFPFTPYSNYKYSHTSPHFSDTSENENLFQNANKYFEKSRRWFKLKTFSYYFSIFMNFITLLGFIYLVSTGTISVDWPLSKSNFSFT